MKKDIESKEDIALLIHQFYQRLLLLEGMPEVFEGLNFEEHKPKIIHFWSFVLLDEPGYTTNVFDKHLRLPIKSYQFNQWLQTFITTVDENFSGEKAELAKQRATTLSFTFESKWKKIKGD